jgi:uncharacterized membrane protein YccC
MKPRSLRNQLVEHFELHVDGTRALRATLAFGIPLAIAHALHRPTDAIFVSLTALNLSQPDLRGAYHVRVVLLAAMTAIAAASAFLGVACADSTLAAVLAMGALALLGGVWRHLSADYGPSAAVSSALLFLLGLSVHGGWQGSLHLAGLAAAGGAVATLLHAVYWLVRPQHALRNAVAETWVALSDMVLSMRPAVPRGAPAPASGIDGRERDLRAALDRTFLILREAQNPRQAVLLAHLEEMRLEAVHVSMRAVALNAAIEAVLIRPEFARCLPAIDSVVKALSDAARSVALTLIMHRDEDYAASSLRLRRCRHLIRAAAEQVGAVPSGGADAAQLTAALEQLEQLLPHTQSSVAETAGHAIRGIGLLPGLSEIGGLSLRSLGAWMRPSARPDPLLVRHAARMAALTMIAVAIYKGFDVAHGYWIALTILVVLQPDFGSTRQRAGARIAGTLAGSIFASGLLLIRMPLPVIDALAAVTAFFFSYYLRRRYRVAVFFVTVYLILITETLADVSLDFMFVRVFATLLGGGMALIAAFLFWPVWEREKFSTLLAAAIRANQAFLQSLTAGAGPPTSAASAPLLARRKAENANRNLSASLERMMGEPVAHREFPERSATLATYNQRLTRALTALAVQLSHALGSADPALSGFAAQVAAMIGDLAGVVEGGFGEPATAELAGRLATLESQFAVCPSRDAPGAAAAGSPGGLALAQLAKAIAEVRAMTLAMGMAA